MTWKELQNQVLWCEFTLNDVEDKLSEIENSDQEATGKAERLMSDVARAIEDMFGEIDDEIP